MRTLKKALSLVLVLAMVLSLGVSAFAVNAKDFSDYSAVTNKEAVDVLAAIGVVNGNTDGTFGPTGNFTRAQAATILSYMTLGTTVANALPASATKFNDVPSTHWAAKYVQYCADAGYINGYGDGNFGPDAQLTANQWALMLLGALGYKAANEKIGGTGWEIATTRLAITAKVATAEELAGTFNRDMAAKMALNTLKADVVEYESDGLVITGTDLSIQAGASKAEKIEKTPAENGNPAVYVKFADEHFPKLTLDTTPDLFGRSQNTWKLDGTKIGSYVTGNATKTYTGTVKATTINKDLGKPTGVDVSVTGNGDNAEEEIDLTDTTATVGGVNTVVEVYYNATAKTVKIVEVKYELAQVTKVTAETTKKNGDVVPASVSLKGLSDGTVPSSFETTGFAKDDIVLVASIEDTENENKLTVQEMIVAKSVEGTATTIRGANVTIDGTTYVNNADFAKNAAKVARGDKGTFYLGVDGSVVYAVTTSTKSDDYGYVYSVKDINGSLTEDGLSVGSGEMAYMVTADGSKVSYVIAKDQKIEEGKMICYKINGDGQLTLGTPDTDKTDAATKAEKMAIGKKTPEMGDYYASAATKFVFVKIDEDKGTCTTSTITGYTNVAHREASEKADVWMVANKDTGRVTTVFVIDSAPAETAENIAILLDSRVTEDTVDGKGVFVYTVMVDGLETELVSKTDLEEVVTKENVGKPFVYTVADGYVTSFKLKETTAATVANYIDDSNYFVDGEENVVYMTADCVVYLIDKTETGTGESAYTTADVTVTALQKKDPIDFYKGTGDNNTKAAVIFVDAAAREAANAPTPEA